jgi:hypothetical protein
VEHCPWHGFAPATIEFCEEQLCSWVTQPSNTWSNLAFVFVGILIHRLAVRNGHQGLKLIGYSAVLLGFGSGMFHASSTFFFEVFDLLGMFLISGILLCFNLQRLTGLSNRLNTIIYVVITSLSLGMMFVWRPSGIATFSLQLTIAMTLELLLHLRRDEISYKYFLYMCGTFMVSMVIWSLDISKKLCDPQNHLLTGHAVWHLLNALAIYFIYKFYTQFGSAKKGRFSLEPAE